MNLSVLSLMPADAKTMKLTESRPRKAPTRGEPVESSTRIFKNSAIIAGVWECTPGCFPVKRVGNISIMFIISGSGAILDPDGTKHSLIPGSVHIEPDKWEGEWDITETVRKFYVIYNV